MAHPNIPINPCESTRIFGHGYDQSTRTLALQFKGKEGPGATYHYANVEPEVYEELCAAESIGKFFGTRITVKNEFGSLKYPHTKIEMERKEG